ncbi:MAG TPA: flagellar biosynthesis anti-sigma factor FlgM [Acidobacteriaceae bacterium]|nr:flagellar biosynthesis anti-sigma factor FlgM [Acidobacteriaceae bacterium]
MNISQEMPTALSITPPIQAAVAKRILESSVGAFESTASDSTELSGAAAPASQTDSTPDARQEKVAAVQAAIADGTYSVPSKDVALALMDHMLGKKV